MIPRWCVLQCISKGIEGAGAGAGADGEVSEEGLALAPFIYVWALGFMVENQLNQGFSEEEEGEWVRNPVLTHWEQVSEN